MALLYTECPSCDPARQDQAMSTRHEPAAEYITRSESAGLVAKNGTHKVNTSPNRVTGLPVVFQLPSYGTSQTINGFPYYSHLASVP